jgi:hypothetical protein
MGIFGAENEALEKSLLKVQSAMALSQGLNAVGQSIDSFKNLNKIITDNVAIQKILKFVNGETTAATATATTATVVQGTATTATAAATTGLTVALRVLRAALVATGIGALVVGIGFLVEKLMSATGATEEQKAAQDSLQLSIDSTTKSYENLRRELDDINQIEVLRGKLAGKNAKEIKDIENQGTLDRIASLQKQRDELDKNNKIEKVGYDNWKKNQEQRTKLSEEIGKAQQEIIVRNLSFELDEQTKAADKQKALQETATQNEKQRRANILRLNQEYTKQLQDLDAKTEEEKLALDKKRALEEMANLKATEEEKLALRKLYARKEEDLLKAKQESINIITNDYNLKLRDLNAKSETDKFNLELIKQKEEESKKLAELDKLKATEEEKNKVRNYYIALEAQTTKDYNDKLKAQRDALYQDQLNAEAAFQAAKRNTIETGLEVLMMFAGKNKEIALAVLAVQKGLAIADIVVNASKSIATQTAASMAATKAEIAQMALVTPFPLSSVLAGGITAKNAALLTKGIAVTKIAAGLNIAAIAASGIQSAGNITGGADGGGIGIGGGGGGGAAAPQFNIVGQNPNNQLAATIAGQQGQPIRAYVVGQDVTTQQGLDRQIRNTATFNS